VPNTTLSCELSQVIIHVNLQELAPLFWRHVAEHNLRLPGMGSSHLPVSPERWAWIPGLPNRLANDKAAFSVAC